MQIKSNNKEFEEIRQIAEAKLSLLKPLISEQEYLALLNKTIIEIAQDLDIELGDALTPS